MQQKPKLRTYCLFKKNLRLEEYLTVEQEKEGRYYRTSLRTGTNNLRIETGRWKRPIEKVEDRTCRACCTQEVEDEQHYLDVGTRT